MNSRPVGDGQPVDLADDLALIHHQGALISSLNPLLGQIGSTALVRQSRLIRPRHEGWPSFLAQQPASRIRSLTRLNPEGQAVMPVGKPKL